LVKATIITKSGATVVIEGTHPEVAGLIARFEEGSSEVQSRAAQRQIVSKPTPMKLLMELASDGFFAKPKELNAIRGALEEQGHFYPPTTLSPIMLRLVRRRELRRIKEKSRWLYVK
jgi:hypothetical protein